MSFLENQDFVKVDPSGTGQHPAQVHVGKR